MAPFTDTSRQVRVLLSLAISAGLLLSLHFSAPRVTGLWWLTLFNSLHVVVFAVVALSIFVSMKAFTSMTSAQNAIVAGVTTIVLSFMSEAAQIPGPRDASIVDLLFDAGGAIGTLLVAFAACSVTSASRNSRVVSGIAGTSILLAPLSPLVSVSAAYIERNARKPVLVSFDSHFVRTFLRTQNATLEVLVHPPVNQKIGQVSLHNGVWPGLIIHDIWPDWRPYSMLIIDLALAGEEPLDINVRVHDRLHKQGDHLYSDRFNMTNVMQPGRHTLRIPLEKIRHAPKERPMDLSHIDGIVIFCSQKDAGRQFELLEIRLE